MTPKEKAKDIYDSYWYCLLQSDIHNRHYWSKQCALIALDLRLEADFLFNSIEYEEDSLEYWQEVKHEIEKL